MLNAAQAIGDEGDPELDEIVVSVHRSGSEVHVDVRDSGCGIEPKNLQHLFEPLFTTKPSGVGSGLGLSICQRIVEGCGGRLEVESEVGEGSRFRVALASGDHLGLVNRVPLSSGEFALAAEHQARLLVIDDDAGVRESLQRILEVGDHHVTVAASGREARTLIDDGDFRFDLIFTDLMMAQGSGIEFFDWLSAAHPERTDRVVFMTGGAYDSASRDFLARITNPILAKPFDPTRLLRLVIEQLALIGFERG